MKSYRPNVSYAAERNSSLRRGSAMEYEMQFSLYQYCEEDDLLILSQRTKAMLLKNHATLLKCTQCGLYRLFERKKFNKIGKSIIKIHHGEYWCAPCHMNTPKGTPTERGLLLQEVYKRIMTRKKEEEDKKSGVFIRQMTTEERVQYGLPPL